MIRLRSLLPLAAAAAGGALLAGYTLSRAYTWAEPRLANHIGRAR